MRIIVSYESFAERLGNEVGVDGTDKKVGGIEVDPSDVLFRPTTKNTERLRIYFTYAITGMQVQPTAASLPYSYLTAVPTQCSSA